MIAMTTYYPHSSTSQLLYLSAFTSFIPILIISYCYAIPQSVKTTYKRQCLLGAYSLERVDDIIAGTSQQEDRHVTGTPAKSLHIDP